MSEELRPEPVQRRQQRRDQGRAAQYNRGGGATTVEEESGYLTDTVVVLVLLRAHHKIAMDGVGKSTDKMMNEVVFGNRNFGVMRVLDTSAAGLVSSSWSDDLLT